MEPVTVIAIGFIIGGLLALSGERQLNEGNGPFIPPRPPYTPRPYYGPDSDYNWGRYYPQADYRPGRHIDGYRRYYQMRLLLILLIIIAVFVLLLRWAARNPAILEWLAGS